MEFLQKLGKSMMLPIAVLPICGILMGIGYIMCPASMQGGDLTTTVQCIGFFLVKAGGAIINNMGILFVIGVSLGMSEGKSGVACLAGLCSWLTVTGLLSTNVVTTLFPVYANDEVMKVAFNQIQNPFIGIICGLMGAFCYNKFKNKELIEAFSFFSGKRFVAIATVLLSVGLALIMAVLWPIMFVGLYNFGNFLKDLGGAGAAIYVFFNRLLIPTGLHHALNNVFWFNTIGIGDLTNFWAGKTSADVGYSLGCYMSGFFPCMMFGIPGAALAIFKYAKNKTKAASILFSCAICAFVCGLTEPFEFLFMFLAFPLYIIYSALYGLFTLIVYYTGFRAGFSFSAGAIDLFFSSSLPAANRTWLIIILGAAAFGLFFLIFKLYLTYIPRKVRLFDEEEQAGTAAATAKIGTAGNKYTAIAAKMLEAVGGAANVVAADCCATRLRLDLKDGSLVDEAKAKGGGALGVFKKGNACQLVIGVTVQQVCDEFNRLCEPAEHLKVTHGQVLQIAGPAAGEAGEAPPAAEEIIESGVFSYTIKDPAGMHARPAGRIAKLMKDRGATGKIVLGDKEASVTSVIELMGLGIKQGDEITVSSDDKAALGALKALIEVIL